MKYIKKPVQIEAILWDGNDVSEIPLWFTDAIKNEVVFRKENLIIIGTLEGDMKCFPGDYIIRGVKGEIYPCKPEIFNLTYDLAE